MWAFLVILLQLQTLQTPILIDVCPAFGVPVSGSGYDRTFVDYALDAEAINAVLSIDASDSFWVGYENGGFDWPQDVQPVLQLTLMMADGAERWLDVWWSEQTPEVYYALPFVTVEAYADAQGEHYGTHPCAAIRMSAAEFETLREAITR